MNKLTKEQMQEALRKSILNCTEGELRFLFHLFSFDLKEFKQETGRVRFEVHFKTSYISRVEITDMVMALSNEWIIFGEDNSHGISMEAPPCAGALLVAFINMFAPNLLQHAGYSLSYNSEWSVLDSLEEAQEYVETAQATMADIVKPLTPTEV